MNKNNISLDGRIKKEGISYVGSSNNFSLTSYIEKVVRNMNIGGGTTYTYSNGVSVDVGNNVTLGGDLNTVSQTTSLLLNNAYNNSFLVGLNFNNSFKGVSVARQGTTMVGMLGAVDQGLTVNINRDDANITNNLISLRALGDYQGTAIELYSSPAQTNAIVIKNNNQNGPQGGAVYANNEIKFSNSSAGITMSMSSLPTFQSLAFNTSGGWEPAGANYGDNTNYSKIPNLKTAVGNSGKNPLINGNGSLYKTPNGYVKVKNTETYYSTLDYQEFPNNLTADVVQNVNNFQSSVPNVFVFNLSSGVYRYSFQTECVELNETVTFTNNSANNVRIGCATNGVYDSNIYFRAGNTTNTPYIVLVGETVTFKKVASNIYYLISKFS